MFVNIFKLHSVIIHTLLFFTVIFSACAQKQKPLKSYPRVKAAYVEKKQEITAQLAKHHITFGKHKLILIGLKNEEQLQAWVCNVDSNYYYHYKTFNFCSYSGKLGPKRKQGDFQIPEGLYNISYYNPWSNYHLSMKVSYPNKSDKIRGDKQKPGNNIFIHGDCVTIGCIPINSDINELFVLAAEARKNNKVKVLLLPTALSEQVLKKISTEGLYPETQKLWKELLLIYKYFQIERHLPKVNITKSGAYQLIQ